MFFAYFPMNLDLLYMIPLAFGNDIIPKLIHFSFGLMTAQLIFSYLRPRTDKWYAFLGALLFLAVPIIIKLSITVYVDLGLVFFSTGSLLYILKWKNSGFQNKYLVISAIFCGLALGTKYSGLVVFFLLTLFVPFIIARYTDGTSPVLSKAVCQGLLFFAVALLVFSPWMIRNWHWRGNPVYPLYNGFFNPGSQSVETGEEDAEAIRKKMGMFRFRAEAYGETPLELIFLPVRIFFYGEDFVLNRFDGKLNPFLLILPFFAFAGKRKSSAAIEQEKIILAAYALLFFSFVFFSTVLRARYFAPMIPPLVILSVFGIRNIYSSISEYPALKRRIFSVGVAGMMAIFAAISIQYLISQFEYVKPLEYLTGRISRDDYITRYRPEYAAMRYINKNLPENAGILFFFVGNRGYYCDRTYLFEEIQFASGNFSGIPDTGRSSSKTSRKRHYTSSDAL